MELQRRKIPIPEGSFFLFGPRGTGKTTWLRQTFPNAVWLDLLDPQSQRSYLARPERLRELVDGNPGATDVVVDEIQKAPGLLDMVHQLIEEKRGLRFILTGSSARKLRRDAVNLLAGRLVRVEMHPFTADELGAQFSLNRALTTGLVPLIWNATEPEQTLRAYAALYLREEVQAEALVRDIGAFARFLEAISFSHASLLNLAAISRECEVGRKTVEGYLGVLEDLMLCFRLPVFARRAKRALVSHEKFYFFDAGVYGSLRPTGPIDKPQEIAGLALEGLVAQHLRAWIARRRAGEQLYFWRTKSGSEVDFVIYGPRVFRAWEVKHSGRVHPSDLRSLKAFKEDFPEASVGMVYLGQEQLEIDGVAVIPCQQFLQGLGAESLAVQAAHESIH
ncbi:MAG: ATP-binding protein [Burkholderiaceae bacterium]|jgi:predicted AAA+ superfamily ATPase